MKITTFIAFIVKFLAKTLTLLLKVKLEWQCKKIIFILTKQALCDGVLCGDHGNCDPTTGKCKCVADTYGDICQYSK